MKKINATHTPLLLIFFIIGVVLCSLGTVVAYTEWQDVEFIEQSEANSFFQMKTVEKTVEIDESKESIFLNDYYYTDVVIDDTMKDNEIKVICRYNPEHYKEVVISSKTDPENRVNVMVGEQFASYEFEMMRHAVFLLKEKKILTNYRDFEVEYIMNTKNQIKVEKGYQMSAEPVEVEVTDSFDEDGITYTDIIEENGETIERRLYKDGRIIYVYPDGTEKEVSPNSDNVEGDS